MKIGCIGLGIMGRPCALNLISQGFEVHVWARRLDSLSTLLAAGARATGSVSELAAQVDVVITNLPDTADVEDVLLGSDGVISAARPGTVCIDMSTISPVATRAIAVKLAERSIELLDCPVSGGEIGAIKASLTIMVGGKQEILESVRPVLAAMGRTITLIGASGAGQVAKACNQIMVGVNIAGVAEALGLARSLGVDLVPVREALLGGFASSRVLDIHGQRIIDDNYAPGFKASLHAKDLGIVLDTARAEGIRLPCTENVAVLLEQLVVEGGASLDSSAISRLIRTGDRADN